MSAAIKQRFALAKEGPRFLVVQSEKAVVGMILQEVSGAA